MSASELAERVLEGEDPKDFLQRLAPRGYVAHFHPQAWVNDYAVDVDPQGPTTWDVTDYIVKLEPKLRAKTLAGNTYESDALRELPNAPRWTAEWSGPFYVEVSDGLGNILGFENA
jgi:hypothetical protein